MAVTGAVAGTARASAASTLSASIKSADLPDLLAQRRDPGFRVAPRAVGLRAHRFAVVAAGGIRPEELHVALLAVQPAQRVGDDLVGDVALHVDDEAVVAETA